MLTKELKHALFTAADSFPIGTKAEDAMDHLLSIAGETPGGSVYHFVEMLMEEFFGIDY